MRRLSRRVTLGIASLILGAGETVTMGKTILLRVTVLATLLLSTWTPAPAQQAATPLRNLTADQIVQQITYCKREYVLRMASGDQHRYPELNLRFKTDTSTNGPERGKPVLLPAGMRGDRGQVIFSGLDDLKRFLI